MITVEEKFAEFTQKTNELARSLGLEVEFTTYSANNGYLSYEAPCVEVVTTNPFAYLMVRGGMTFGETVPPATKEPTNE